MINKTLILLKNTALILISFSLFTLSGLAQAAITQSIDRTEIHAGESFVFTIQVDEDTGEEPDLSLIPKEFTIISNSQYQQMSYVNGRSSTIKGWKIKLSTLKTGNISIPPITVGNAQTKKVDLFIKDTSDRVDLKGQNKAIFLESSISAEQVYVQQQIVLTIKLYRAINTHYARLTEPFAGDSIIEKLGDDSQYDKTIDNTRYVITERRYAIFPQQSGDLEIDAVNFTADINDPNSRGSNRFLNTTRPISVSSKAHSVKVLPQPATASLPWMPASEVVLADKWSSSSNQLTIGEPVTWTILLYAQGLSESQIPDIKFPKVNGLQFYPDTPQKERQVNERGILGQRIEKLAVIPSKEGEITIPKVEVTWWDTQSNTQKVATLPSKTFTVIAGEKAAQELTQAEQISPTIEQKQEVLTQEESYWKEVAIVYILLWLTTVFAYVRKSPSVSTENSKGRNKPKQARDKQDKHTPLTESQHLKNLQQAIKSKDTHAIEIHLLTWASQLCDKTISSLGQLTRYLSDQELIDKLEDLQSSRYSNQKIEFEASISKGDLQIIASAITKTNSKERSDKIPPLYSK